MKNLAIVTALIVLSSFLVLGVRPDFTTADVNPSNGKASVVIPSHAIELTPGVFSIGSGIDTNGRLVEGYMVFHHKSGHKSGPGNGGGENKCYAFLANGAKWRNIEPWVVNANNSNGLTDSFVLNNIGANIAKWESESGKDILGQGTLTFDNLEADTTSPIDNVNEVYFGDISDPGAIAVTIVWGVFRGPPSQRGLVSWDMVFDDVDYNWSDSGEASKMDFENIANHEIGHAVGLGHPENTCTEETMFAFAELGETKKRNLNPGDISGIIALYA